MKINRQESQIAVIIHYTTRFMSKRCVANESVRVNAPVNTGWDRNARCESVRTWFDIRLQGQRKYSGFLTFYY